MTSLTELPTQAEVWLADFGPGLRGEPVGHRPVIVLAPAIEYSRHAPTVTVVPLTRRERPYVFRHEVLPSPDNGLAARSFAQIDQIRSVNTERLIHYVGYVDAETWGSVRDLVHVYLDA